MKMPLALLALALAPALASGLSGCAAAVPQSLSPGLSEASPPGPAPGVTYAGMGETIYVDGPKVTPLAIIEDSRCPQDVYCVWAGRMRISARIDLGAGSEVRELTLHKPEPVADGTLELAEVWPPRAKAPADAPPRPWRFGFRFLGGL